MQQEARLLRKAKANNHTSATLSSHTSTALSNHTPTNFGVLLKQWRNQRSLSQLDLSLLSQVSQRHISFLESGRAKPSQEMVLQLAAILEIPLRHQNLLLNVSSG